MKEFITCLCVLCCFLSKGQDWQQMEKVVAPIRAASDQFGIGVAISGDYAIAGAYLEDEDANGENTMADAGAAYIYHRDDCDWVLVQKISASDRAAQDWFGQNVAMSGNFAAVSAFQEDEDENGANTLTDAGAVYMFKNINGVWTQTQKIVPGDRGALDNFGFSISISGNDMIIGSYREDEDANGNNTVPGAGSAYIYKNIGGIWYQVQKIVASSRDGNENFGISVNIAGNMAVVGAYGDQEDANEANPLLACGSAFIFINSGGVWSQVQKITNTDRNTFDRFGFSVGIGEDHILVGANQEDHDENGGNFLNSAGAVYSFTYNGAAWVQNQKILPADRGAGDFFGNNISISEDLVLISSYRDDEDASGGNTLLDAGSAYLFRNENGTWVQFQKICSTDRGAGDFFSLRVGMSGDYVFIGANIEDEDENGINTINAAGSAYFFRNTAGESCEGALDVCAEIDDFIADILASSIPQGIQNALTSKLSNAKNSFINGQSNAAINKLNAFINQVMALSGGAIPTALAEQWIARAQMLIDAIASGEAECEEANFAEPLEVRATAEVPEDLIAISLFPNPGSQALILKWMAVSEGSMRIEVLDPSGRLLQSEFVRGVKGENQKQLNMEAYRSGMYFIRILATDRNFILPWVKADF